METRLPFLGPEDSLEEGLQYSCLDNPKDRGAGRLEAIGWPSLTLLKRLSTHTPEAQPVLLTPSIYPTSRERQSYGHTQELGKRTSSEQKSQEECPPHYFLKEDERVRKAWNGSFGAASPKRTDLPLSLC